jgi:hypothetical protein
MRSVPVPAVHGLHSAKASFLQPLAAQTTVNVQMLHRIAAATFSKNT